MRARLLLLALALLGAGCGTDEPAPARHGYEVLVVSGENDAARQNQQVEDFVARRVDAIVLSPCDSKAVGQSVRKANAAGVPVFTVDIACLDPGAEVVAHVATDNYSGGRQAAA